jgi:pilus assembly protein CpaE
MLTAAVVSSDAASRAALVKTLQQTGLVRQICDYSDSPDAYPALTQALPEVVLLDLSPVDPDPQFEVAAFLYRLSPAIRIVACSALQEPDSALLIRAMRYGMREFLRMPLEVDQLREVLMRFTQDRSPAVAKGPQKLIAVIGAKGGVGTTTVAVNLGVQLAQVSRKRVALLDLARPMGHAALMLDLQPKFSLRDAAQNFERLDGHLLNGFITPHKSGLGVLAGISDPNEWSAIEMKAIPRIADVARNNNDFVIADMGVHCPAEWAPILSAARCILLVSEAHVLSLWAVERQFSALVAQDIEPSLLRLVINRWHRRDDGVLKSVEQRTKRNIFLRLPNNFSKVNEAVNTGTPLADNHDNAIVSQLRQFAIELAGAPSEARRGAFSNLFSSHTSK